MLINDYCRWYIKYNLDGTGNDDVKIYSVLSLKNSLTSLGFRQLR